MLHTRNKLIRAQLGRKSAEINHGTDLRRIPHFVNISEAILNVASEKKPLKLILGQWSNHA